MRSLGWRRPTGVVAAGLLAVLALAAVGAGCARLKAVAAGEPDLQQGWSAADRQTFYRTGQGSHMIPLAWFKALQQPGTTTAFDADQLTRYGYLRDDGPQNPDKLPVGFVVDTRTTPHQLGLTCAACHSAEIDFTDKAGKAHALRVDGAPTGADFQRFLTDLQAAADATVASDAALDGFAHRVLGAGYGDQAAGQLKRDFRAWVAQFDDFMNASLPRANPWGPGRLDAFGMIFNRVAARDLGVHGNFALADAPVSYPFLWNAHAQDKVQWNGAVPNGLYLGALGRNSGEVLGVFADFQPRVLTPLPRSIAFDRNSIDFEGLQTLEEKVAALKPPKWPKALFGYDEALAKTGAQVYQDQHCGQCHDAGPSALVPGARRTLIQAVGTDPRMAANAARQSDTGLFQGAPMLPALRPFGATAPTGEVLRTAVLGVVGDHLLHPPLGPANALNRAVKGDGRSNYAPSDILNLLHAQLATAYDQAYPTAGGAAYEARSLQGIWATAPYLHNGSVANLWELLTPPGQRRASFAVGSRQFDPKMVGFDTEHSPLPGAAGRFTVDAGNGNGNGGHPYGTQLPPDKRWALIEYLKGL
ncbi:di-heme-cytochrome C peroxidase [Caulobacter sp. KR2-114]|uniref:di-heme-cytochrome C peroxidase n=1 Tax=Caulobacter sp. KR2-114 TaxID=3400912 RepID=UPI003C0DB033